MEKMRMESVDIKAKNIEKVAEIFPNCITETYVRGGYTKSINFELLRQMLSSEVIEGDESYEFTWVGKKASIVEANKPIRKTLRPCEEESVNWNTTENLYIEGDNLEVLKLLQESYLGKVKMIYIDPPYNTGNDFIYNDDFKINKEEYAEESGEYDDNGNRMFRNTDSNGRFHSDWCSMIYSRLLVVRNLLSEDGFIAISIGEEEEYNLRKICNEIFGEANFRNIISVRRYDKNINLQFVENGLSTMNVGLEYILVYSKTKLTKMKAVYKESSDERSNIGYWKGFWNNANRPTMRYNILGVNPKEGQWKWGQGIAEEAVNNYLEYEKHFKDNMTLEEYWSITGRCKRFLRCNQNGVGKNQGVEHWVPPSEGILRNSNWSDYLISKPIGMDLRFNSPKNPDVIKGLIELFNVCKNDIILDFFSGSATTAHAVLQLNAEDNGHRKFIMVQLPESIDEKSEAYKAGYKNICEIGKERIRRAGKKILEENCDKEGIENLDIGFRVLKLDESNMTDVYYSPDEYSQDLLARLESNIKTGRNDLDLLFSCLLEWGLPLSLPYSSEKIEDYTVHNYNNGDLIACFEENIPDSVIKEIAKKQPLRAVFRDSSFVNSPSKINVGEIFKLLAPDTRVKVI